VTAARLLHQWFTPRWVAEVIVERYFADLDLCDKVLEPACGPGAFLHAIPDHVDAVGVEIDPVLAAEARLATGRPVITGDFLQADLPAGITHVVGNPPFDARLIHAFLARCHSVLPDGGTAGFLLPAYVLQTSSKVVALNARWSISQELVPRNVFPRLSLPLVFARFVKDRRRALVGFFLYREVADVAALPAAIRHELAAGGQRGSVWRRAVRLAFARLGAVRATLEALYAAVERPTENRHWREKVRQTLQAFPEFRRAGAGLWEMRTEATAQ
jgi:SAM-dependent methyltransferase